jgi:hypothetical protein
MNLSDLKKPFDPSDVEFRAGATNRDKTSALALPYLTSRAVMDRLDEVCGPENWQDLYTSGPDGGVLCGISIRVGEAWITKFDGAENSNIEAIKGGLSDAFKRAGVKWGIGRYLYSLPSIWVKAEPRGNSISIDEDEARKKLFGQQPQRQVEPPRKLAQDSTPGFASLDELLYQLGRDFGLTESEAKSTLKDLGFSGFPKNGEAFEKSKAMYKAVKEAMKGKR